MQPETHPLDLEAAATAQMTAGHDMQAARDPELEAAMANFPVGAVDYGPGGEPERIAELRRRLPTKVYVAGLRGGELEAEAVEELCAAGFEVTAPAKEAWAAVDPCWKGWTPAELAAGLDHEVSREQFTVDFRAMALSEVCLFIAPGDPSALLEAGWFAAQTNKRLVILVGPSAPAPALMFKLADSIVTTLEAALEELDRHATELRNSTMGFGGGDKVLFSTPRMPERVMTLLGCLGFRPALVDPRTGWDELASEIATQAMVIEASTELGEYEASDGALVVALEAPADEFEALGAKPLLMSEAGFARALECAWLSGRVEGRCETAGKLRVPQAVTDHELATLGVPEATQLSIEFEDEVVVVWVELEGEASRREFLLPRNMVYGSVVVRIATALEVMLKTVTGADWISADGCQALALQAFEDYQPPS